MSQEGVGGEGEGTWAFCAAWRPQSSLGRGFRCNHWVLMSKTSNETHPPNWGGTSWAEGLCTCLLGRWWLLELREEQQGWWAAGDQRGRPPPQSCAEIPSELRGNSAINPEFPLPFGRVEGGWPTGEGIGSR